MKIRTLAAAALLSSPALAQAPLSGGETSVVLSRAQSADRGAFSLPATNLSLVRKGDFFAGNSFFQNAWVTAPASTEARDGLGPIFNTMSCQSCHVKDGRGRPPKGREEMLSMLIRISVPGGGDDSIAESLRTHGIVPEPVYGGQIQNKAIAGVEPEAKVVLEWEQITGEFDDGKKYRLRKPRIVLEDLAYGEISGDVLTSGRVAPALVGLGLLDTIPDEALEALADPDDADGNGISGRLNSVWNATKGEVDHGRFGWKSEQPTVRQQVAAAFLGDIGITSSVFPTGVLSGPQAAKVDVPNGGEPEVSDEILDLVTFYCKTLAVPARRGHDDPVVMEGEKLFREAGCAACHVESFVTGDDPDFPELSGQTIFPYTDLLLHDMGEGLADDRPVFGASGREWRTPPLWGSGLVFRVNQHTNFLHDGRARNVEEAILWHGGEGAASRDKYKSFSADQRRKLLVFLKSL